MEPIIPLISEVGFPIAVTLYLLYRIESKLDVVVQSIQGLPERLKGNDLAQEMNSARHLPRNGDY